MNSPSDQDPQDRHLHDELRRLPVLQAPATLLPNVLAAVAARQVAWWRQPFFAWPRLPQVGVSLAGLAVAAAFIFFGPELWQAISAPAAQAYATTAAKLAAMAQVAGSVADAFALAGGPYAGWALAGAAAVVAMLYVSLIAAGSAFWRLALHTRPDQA
jgi:hypothetical protein